MNLEVISHIPRGAARPTPILLVHGAWHGAWCWERVQPYLAQRGYATHALSLRGHGGSGGRERIRWHSAARGYVADVARAVADLPAPPVLVGHSMGGYVVQKYLETRSAPAAVLLASIPAAGTAPFLARYLRRHPWAALKSLALLDTRHLVGTPALARDAFFSPDLPENDLLRHAARLQSESLRVALETAGICPPRPRRVRTPLLVLGAANDAVFSVESIRATARAYGTEAEIFPDMAHDMMLEPGWRRVADRILAWLAERGL